MKILIEESDQIAKEALELLSKKKHQLFFRSKKSNFNPKEIEVIFIRTYTQISKEYLRPFENVKYILRAGVGMDNIDRELCRKKNITVINSPGANANAVSEYVLGIMIMLLRNIETQSAELKKRKWRDYSLMGEELKGKTVGLIGCGAISRNLANKLRTLELKKVIGYDPFLTKEQLRNFGIEKKSFQSILKTADIVSLHIPLTPQTKNLISRKELRQMKPTSYLINSARGGIVNEEDLIYALKNNYIRAAALDVFEHEPDIRKKLYTTKKLIITPHIAGFTQEANKQIALQPVYQFLKHIE